MEEYAQKKGYLRKKIGQFFEKNFFPARTISKKTISKNKDKELTLAVGEINGSYYSIITFFQNSWSNAYKLDASEMILLRDALNECLEEMRIDAEKNKEER